QPDRLALEPEAAAQREHPAAAVPVLQRDRVLLAEHHGPAELGRVVLDDQTALGRDLRKRPLTWPAPLRREHVLAVLPAPHVSPALPGAPITRKVLTVTSFAPAATPPHGRRRQASVPERIQCDRRSGASAPWAPRMAPPSTPARCPEE